MDEAANHKSARWLKLMSYEYLWRALRMCSLDISIGSQDVIAHDPGKHFMGAAFQARSDKLTITTKAVPVKTAHSMTVVECYHAPVHCAYRILKQEANDLDDELALNMTVKSVNDRVDSERLFHTSVVSDNLPRTGLTAEKPACSTFQHIAAMHKVHREVRKIMCTTPSTRRAARPQ